MPFENVEIAFISASKVSEKSGVPLWEPYIPVTDDDQDAERFGPTAVYQALGFASQPWPADESGHAECILFRNCGGRPAVCIGGSDTRTASVIGNLQPGDTVVYSTGPNQAAQLQLKEAKRQTVLVTKTPSGENMAVILDGLNEKAQITKGGAIFEIDKNNDVSILNGSGVGLLMQGDKVFIKGTLVVGEGNPSGQCFMLGPVAGSPGGGASAPMIPAQGIAPG